MEAAYATTEHKTEPRKILSLSLRGAHFKLQLPAPMQFAMSPDSLLFFCSVAASVAAAFGLFSLYRRLAHRGQPGAALPAGDSEEHRPRTVASSLPAFMYNRLVRHSGKGASWTECAVCLSVIQVGAMVKLLPACAHVYHVDCIDLWLFSHSTCPLCRCRVTGAVEEGKRFNLVMRGLQL